MIVKICGLTHLEDAEFARNAGADVLGFICGVPESPRNNDLDSLKGIFSELETVKKALLFRNSKLEDVLSVLKVLKPEVVHLCGQETQTFRAKIKEIFPNIEIWQTVGVPLENPDDSAWLESVQGLLKEDCLKHIVLDSAKGGKAGGVGQNFPFKLVGEKLGQKQEQIIVAGGLNPNNLKELFANIQPLGLDLSSGVEQSPGKKDFDKIEDFFSNLKKVE